MKAAPTMTSTMEYLLGIDGGGTSTTAWLASADGTILGRGGSGPSNIKAVGQEAAFRALERSVQNAFGNAKRAPGKISVACLGLAGFDRAEDRELLGSWGSRTYQIRKLVLVNDGDLVLSAGTPEGWGVAVIAGTGSIAVGGDARGHRTRSGGWGHLFGDEGSGYKAVVDALRLVARRSDGRDVAPRPDLLTQKICYALGAAAPEKLVSVIYRADCDRARLASLAPLLNEVAADDPEVLETILKPAGTALAEIVMAVARKLDLPQSPAQLPLALAGSFLLNSPAVRNAMTDHLLNCGYSPHTADVAEPARGAVDLALKMLHA